MGGGSGEKWELSTNFADNFYIKKLSLFISFLCKCKNKQKEPSEVIGKKLHDNMKLYFKFANDIMFYKYTLKTTKDQIKYDMTEARLDDATSRLWHIREELQQYN